MSKTTKKDSKVIDPKVIENLISYIDKLDNIIKYANWKEGEGLKELLLKLSEDKK